MSKPRLRFFCRGTAHVTDFAALDREPPLRRFVGRRFQEVTRGRWSWTPTEEPQEVAYHHDLVKACKDGDLWAADAATAEACGVPFDPNFGGEETESIKAFKAKMGLGTKPGNKPGDKTGGKGDV